MKFAVIKTGGKQYRVAPGDVVTVEKLPESAGGQVGEKVIFKKVLLTNDGEKTTIGVPTISGATVTGKTIATGRSKKITVIKYKSKVRYRVKRGHRQPYTKVKIATIDSGARS
ncbi:MAG TPA: 50S ribosomal protein L21 [Candidatus Paceibacterota bacterium]